MNVDRSALKKMATNIANDTETGGGTCVQIVVGSVVHFQENLNLKLHSTAPLFAGFRCLEPCAHMHTCMHAYIHTHIYTYIHACIDALCTSCRKVRNRAWPLPSTSERLTSALAVRAQSAGMVLLMGTAGAGAFACPPSRCWFGVMSYVSKHTC